MISVCQICKDYLIFSLWPHQGNFLSVLLASEKKNVVYREHTSSGLPRDCEGETGNKLIDLPKEMKLSDETCE